MGSDFQYRNSHEASELMGVARGGPRRLCLPSSPQSILDKSNDLGNYDKHLPLRDCFLAGLLISTGLTTEKYNTTLLFA